MLKLTIERLHAIAVGVILCLALVVFVVKRVLGMDAALWIGLFLSTASVLTLLLGYRALKSPREIPHF